MPVLPTGILAAMNGTETPHSRISSIVVTTVLALGSSVAAQDPDAEPTPPWWATIDTESLLPENLDANGLPVGWSMVGGPASYGFTTDERGARILEGRGGAARNAFLVDPTIRGDFLLELEVRIARGEGNSGIQIRSTVDEPGRRMFGYQIEVDPSERAWSGGLYDEGRRGWIASLANNVDAREAFVPGAWNRYTILAIGPRIRTWVNDVPAVDHIDFKDAEGRIGLQIHSGRCDVAWKELRIADLGRRRSRPILGPEHPPGTEVVVEPAEGLTPTSDGWRIDPEGVAIESRDPWPEGPSGLRMTCRLEKGSLRLVLGDADLGPGYVATIPAPLGTPDEPAVIRVWRWSDRMILLVDDVPLVPGPASFEGPLRLRFEAGQGTIGSIRSIEIDPPTDAERRAFERSTSGDGTTGTGTE